MNKKLTLTGANVLFLIFTVIFIGYQLVLGMYIGDRFTDYVYTIVIINQLIILASVLIYCLIKRINIRETFRFNNPGLIPMLIITLLALPATFAAGMLNTLVIYLLQFIGDVPAAGIPVPQNLTELLIGILIIGVLPGICEEMMHRGLLLRAYEKRGSYKAVVFVAILFGMFHFDITNLLGPIFLGLIIGYYVIRTNSILAGIYAHFLNNAISEIIQFIAQRPQPKTLTISTPELISSIFIGTVCLFITAGLLILFKNVTEKRAVIVPPISRTSQDIRAIVTHWPIILYILLYFIMTMLNILAIVVTKYLEF